MSANVWYVSAFLLILLELFGVFHFAALFTGLSALITGLFIEFNLLAEASRELQFTLFLILSVCSICLSWLFTKNVKPSDPFNDVIGSRAILIKPPHPKRGPGLIRWSGTDLIARYAEVDESLEAGSEVTITHIKGNVAYIKGGS